MNIIKPTAFIDFEEEYDVYRKLESIGRVCYKSEDKATLESSKSFIRSIIKKGHESVIEHQVFVLNVNKELYYGIVHLLPKFLNLTSTELEKGNTRYLISGSARGFKDLLRKTESPFTQIIVNYLYGIYPLLFECEMPTSKNFTPRVDIPKEVDQFCYIHKIITNEKIKGLSYKERLKHQFVTVRFICDRGISHEAVRHRSASFSQSSTRYCNYNDSRFGGQITLVDPLFYKSGLKRFLWWYASKTSEYAYILLTKLLGSTPQEARSVLNNSLQTELIMTANIEEWELFFSLRDAKPAHPQMREITAPLHQEFKDKNYLYK
jgi:thymidylate synthase (FAD)